MHFNYEISGTGEKTLLLLHGWGGSTASFAGAARDLNSDFRIINVDFPGFGKSDEPPVPWTVDEYCELVHDMLLENGVKRVSIIAHSFGGRVALLLSSRYPELVEKQVLTGCAGLVDPESESRSYSKLYDNKLTNALFGKKGVDWLRNTARSLFGSADYKAASPIMRETLKNVVTQDLKDCLDKITASTLLIWGENDTATPLWMGKKMEKRIADAGLIVFEGCTHFAYLEQYGRFITIVRQFLI